MSKTRKWLLSAVALLGVVFASGTAVLAGSIQIDFSDKIGSYTGFESPGFAAGDFTASETTWNMVDADLSSGLLYSDGTAATGIQVDLGQGGGATVDWATGLSEASSGTVGTTIYDTDLMRDWVYSANNNNLGARVSGLPAGDYRVYALVREPNQLGRLYDVSIGVNIDTLGALPTAIADAAGVTTWTDGMNFTVADVTTTSDGDWISIIVDPTNANWGTLEGLQIVPITIPEPGSLGLLTLAVMGFVPFVRRRK